jgi:hypothetical protein
LEFRGDAGKSITTRQSFTLFVWIISHQPAVLFSQNKPATNNQPAVLFSQNKSAPAIGHQPNEQAASLCGIVTASSTSKNHQRNQGQTIPNVL